MNRHTPGPWTAEINCTSVVSAGDIEIAVVEEGADAFLIAAAPDLYEALRAVVAEYDLRRSEYLANGDHQIAAIAEQHHGKRIAAARAAIARAEGR